MVKKKSSSQKPYRGLSRNLAYMLRTLALHKLCFYSGRIRTLVAMATYSSHRLIMGKVEIDNFCQVIGEYLIFFTEIFIQ